MSPVLKDDMPKKKKQGQLKLELRELNPRSPYMQKFTEISEEKSNEEHKVAMFHLPSISGSHASYHQTEIQNQ